MRALTLHPSALNDTEYAIFTTTIREILDDPHFQSDDDYANAVLQTRELRAWLRGRYNEIPVTDLDAILKMVTTTDTLSGLQMFAVMRLVEHAKTGKVAEAGLVFVQCKSYFAVFGRLCFCGCYYAFRVQLYALSSVWTYLAIR